MRSPSLNRMRPSPCCGCRADKALSSLLKAWSVSRYGNTKIKHEGAMDKAPGEAASSLTDTPGSAKSSFLDTSNYAGTEEHRAWRELDPGRYFFFGSLASMSIDFLFYPLKLVKTRLQVQGSSTTSHSKQAIYPSTWSSLVKIKQME